MEPDEIEKCRECMLKSRPLTKLKGKYVKVVDKIKHVIKSKSFEVKELIEKLCLTDANNLTIFSTDEAFSKIATVDQLFFNIGKYCNIYDYEMLESFLESLEEGDDAVKLLDDFTEELEDSILKELDLMSESKGQLEPKKLMKGAYTLKVKYHGDQTCTLSAKKMVQRIVNESLGLNKPSIVFIGLEEGCIAFVYQISAAVKSYILSYKITPEGHALLTLHDIECLIVDGTEIPVPVEFKAFKAKVSQYNVKLCMHACMYKAKGW